MFDTKVPNSYEFGTQVEEGELAYRQAQKLYGAQGRSTVLVWLRKHGTLGWSKPMFYTKQQSKQISYRKIKRLEKELSDERLKNEILNRMIDLSEQQHGTGIRKIFPPKQSGGSSR